MTSAASNRPPSEPLEAGRVVADRYVVRSILGQGGMGQVVEVEHLELGRRFALKVLRLERWNDELVKRFNREARALAKLSTPRVAQVTDFGIDAQAGPFYVMELLDGETLEDRIEREHRISPRVALTLGAEICDALADVHAEGIVHRDLKPSNVGLPKRGPVGVKLIDFGLAASMDDRFLSRITQSQQILGSLPYMAPEQFNGAAPAASMDLYAVGILLYEILTGRLPFMAPTTAALIHQILATPVPPLPPELRDLPMVHPLLEQLLAKEPGRRFASAKAAGQAIRDVLATLGGGPLHPHTRSLPGEVPITLEAPAVDGDEQLARLPTLLVAESGTRLTGSVPPPPEPSAPFDLAPQHFPATPLAGTPVRRDYGAVAQPQPTPYGYDVGVSVSTSYIAPPRNPWLMRILLAAGLGLVFSVLTALVVAVGLMILDDADTAARAPRLTERAAAAAPVPAPAPLPTTAMEPNPRPGVPAAVNEADRPPERVTPREVREDPPTRWQSHETQPAGRRPPPPPNDPIIQPQIRPPPPHNQGSSQGGNNGVIREW